MSSTHRPVDAGCTKRVGFMVLFLLSVMACVLVCAGTAEAAATKFKDVPTDHPHYIQIETLASLGIIEGYSDHTFGPDDPIKRQQFAKMVVLAMHYKADNTDRCVFLDMAKSSDGALYPYHYVAAAVREGIINGYVTPSGPEFRPGANITLAQVITMGTRAAGRPLEKPPASYKSAWADFDPAHSENARIAQYNGLLQGLAAPSEDIESLSPSADATRAQAAALLFNIMGTDLRGVWNGTPDRLASFLLAVCPTPGFTVPARTLAEYYVRYCAEAGLRADFLWAQMIHETGYGSYKGDVRPEQNNFAGLGATGGGVAGNTFVTAEDGVMAHIAHMVAYVYTDSPVAWANSTVDPRFNLVRPRGAVMVLSDLDGRWAVPGVGYGDRIEAIARRINTP